MISYKTPIVEIDGDEMTRVLWQQIKDILLKPFVQLNTEYYDLGLKHRDETNDQVTVDAANAIKKYGIGVKCATITPNAQRLMEYNLKKLYPSPNATIRAILDGTVFRAPIIAKNIMPYVGDWTKPITIARHAYGDIYKAVEFSTSDAVKVQLSITQKDGTVNNILVADLPENGGIILGQHNTHNSISSFAKSCFEYAVKTKQDLWFATKDTISKTYDGTFKIIFEAEYKNYWKLFSDIGITYNYSLIDDSVARAVRSNGGFIWALKNYDGDVLSDMVASAYGSLAMMTSVLVSPTGELEFEAAHGTVTRHYYKHLKGEKTSTNPVATIFAWSGALKARANTENNAELSVFAEKLEKATLDTIANGNITGDLSCLVKGQQTTVLDSENFLRAIASLLLCMN